jgi:TetR/AcrR family transcriptional regulator, lmrAB and yxaGH operons repressor
MIASKNTLDTRARLIRAMQIALASKGFHGIGLNELLANAEAPKGVMYHHFPGGKAELALAAIDKSTEVMLEQLSSGMAKFEQPADAIAQWFEAAIKNLSQQNYELGCPLATVALETVAADVDLRQAIAESFLRIRQALADALRNAGITNSKPLAALVVSAFEGALMQARVAQSPKPLRDALEALLPMLRK